MNTLSALLLAGAFALAYPQHITAQDNNPPKRATSAAHPQPVLVAGTEFMILDTPPSKPIKEASQLRLPIMVVVLFWIVAMFFWQIYFNRKNR